MTCFYRYRGAARALSELENREIHFSGVEDLNDPMEGFKDLFWLGDEIVWRALLKHYVLCLLQTAYCAFLAGPDFDPKTIERIVFQAPGSLPNAPIRDVYNALVTHFLDDPAVTVFLDAVKSRREPMRRNELLGYLRALHPLASIPLFIDMRTRSIWPNFVPPPIEQQSDARRNAINIIQARSQLFASKEPDDKTYEKLFAAFEATAGQVELIALSNLPDRDNKRPLVFIMSDFPRAYTMALDKLVHGDCFVACFTRQPDNFAMWNTYGDGHRGICLMFEPTPVESADPVLHLNRVVGASASIGQPTVPVRRFVPHPIRPVKYVREYPAIDFFRSLGRIRQTDLNNFWYRGDNEQFSACKDAVYDNEERWRQTYWQTFAESALYKTPEWAHEEEYRAIAYSVFGTIERDERTFLFRFADLKGVIFGARTATETKLKAMEIVSRKCAAEGRSDFKFFEARYSADAFQVQELALLKVTPSIG